MQETIDRLEELAANVPVYLDPNRPPDIPDWYEALMARLTPRLEEGETLSATYLLVIGNIEFSKENSDLALELYKKAASQAQAENSPALEAVALSNLSSVYLGTGQQQMVLRMAQKSLELASGVGDHRIRARSLIHLGIAMKLGGQKSLAKPSFEQACDIAIKEDLPDEEGLALLNLAFFDYVAGKFDDAVTRLRRALDRWAVTGNIPDQVRGYYNLGLVHADAGRPQQGLENLRRAMELRDRHNLIYGDNKIEAAIDEIKQRLDQPSGDSFEI